MRDLDKEEAHEAANTWYWPQPDGTFKPGIELPKRFIGQVLIDSVQWYDDNKFNKVIHTANKEIKVW